MPTSKAERRSIEIMAKLGRLGVTRDEVMAYIDETNKRGPDRRPERIIEDLRDDVLKFVADAEARGRAAERAEIVALIRARAAQRVAQAAACDTDLGWWELIETKASECDAVADLIEKRGGGAA
jgi:hypothetical protein